MRKLLLLAFASCLLQVARAQESEGQTMSSSINQEAAYDWGVHFGSQGFGLNIAHAFGQQFGLRLSGSYAPYGFSEARSWASTNYNLDVDMRFGNIQLQGEFKPFRLGENGKNAFWHKLAITAGGAYFMRQEGRATATPTNPYQYGDIAIQPENMGTVNVKSTWNEWAPYAGLGLRNMRLGGQLGLNLDLGTYYLSSPKVSMTADKLLASNTSNAPTIENNLKNYRWLPVLQLGLAYQFKPTR